MANLKERAKKAVSGLGRRGRTTRIPDEVRAAVLTYARGERERGVKWREIARTVGLSESVLARWMSGERRHRQSARIVPVRVALPRTSIAAAGGVTLVSPSGYRVEGLAMIDALEALQTLA